MSPKRELKRWLQNMRLKWRWRNADHTSPDDLGSESGLERCDIVYINLDHRTDRREKIEKEFAKIGAKKVKRFPAYKHERGAIGCAMSHHEVLASTIIAHDRILMICEDDLEFTVNRQRLDHLIEEFYKDSRMDVLCLAYNRRNGIQVSPDFLISSSTRTTACYLAKPRAIKSLEMSALKSIELLKQGLPEKVAAIDVVWSQSQKDFIFALSHPRAAVQSLSYSDILGREVDYKL